MSPIFVSLKPCRAKSFEAARRMSARRESRMSRLVE
jgi:hypothetical protein